MKLYRIFGLSVLLCLLMPGVHAQTQHDSIPGKGWSIYAQGGLGSFHGLRGFQSTDYKALITPSASLGVEYKIRYWVRVGLNIDYAMLKAKNTKMSTTTETVDGFQIGDRYGVLTRDIVSMLNRQDNHYLGVDFNVDFNILEFWKHDKHNWGLWVGAGVGYLHGFNLLSDMTAVKESAIAQGEDYFNTYNNSYIISENKNHHSNSMYIPVQLSIEYSINHNWAVGLYGKYVSQPLDIDMTPEGMMSGGAMIRYSFGKGQKHQKKSNPCTQMAAEVDQLMASNNQLKERVEKLQKDSAELMEKLNSTMAEQQLYANGLMMDKSYIVYFRRDVSEISAFEKMRLDDYIAKIKKMGNVKLTITGESSIDGSERHNYSLSEKRTESVVNYLREQGIRNDISTQSLGDSAGGEGWAYRRVMIVIEQ